MSKKPVIWYLLWLIFIDLIFWPSEVISRSLGSFEVKKGSQNRIQSPKNLWFDTSHDLFSLISYFDLQRSLISGGQDLHDHLRSKRGLRIESKHQKTCDLIPHMIYFFYFIFWPSEVISRPPGSSEVKQGSQNGIGTPKNLWSHLISANDIWVSKKCEKMSVEGKSGIFPYFLFSWRPKWRSMTSNLKFSLWSMLTTKIRGCMQNFSLLSQFLRPNTACTKFGVTKCQSAPPSPPPTLTSPRWSWQKA